MLRLRFHDASIASVKKCVLSMFCERRFNTFESFKQLSSFVSRSAVLEVGRTIDEKNEFLS